MFLQIFCTMLSGRPLNDAAREWLLKTACKLYQEGNLTKKFKTEYIEGRLTTRGEYVSLGAVYGMMFYGVVETEVGKSKVDFIVRVQDLKHIELDKILENSFWLGRSEDREAAALWN